jgi:hypothetical protein
MRIFTTYSNHSRFSFVLQKSTNFGQYRSFSFFHHVCTLNWAASTVSLSRTEFIFLSFFGESRANLGYYWVFWYRRKSNQVARTWSVYRGRRGFRAFLYLLAHLIRRNTKLIIGWRFRIILWGRCRFFGRCRRWWDLRWVILSFLIRVSV